MTLLNKIMILLNNLMMVYLMPISHAIDFKKHLAIRCCKESKKRCVNEFWLLEVTRV